MQQLQDAKTALIYLGRRVMLSPLEEMGRIAFFLFAGLMHIVSYPWQLSKIIEQVYIIGSKSIPVICLSSCRTPSTPV